jgi:hypothetical protein
VQNSLEAAKHAVEKGFISAAALPEISGEKLADETAAATEPELPAGPTPQVQK